MTATRYRARAESIQILAFAAIAVTISMACGASLLDVAPGRSYFGAGKDTDDEYATEPA
ncbi:hypothetical protein BV133_614 [Blastochloris viridis]|uniref:Uncharacterized protein n=1 Tax=Blastochloris viridis TaxID=1079 RepID=A0A182CZI9_BLAVI|nr:hypothetical protein BV133_614 [Blastochloris viridis]